MRADSTEFQGDLEEPSAVLNPARLMSALRRFGERHELELDFDLLAGVPGVSLLNGLSVALPFRPAEKQALLEAPDVAQRQELLLTLLKMGLEIRSASGAFTH